MKQILQKLIDIGNNLFGTKFQETIWRIRKYGGDMKHPHRAKLVEVIKLFNPESILEIGCGNGANQELLKKSFKLVDGTDLPIQAWKQPYPDKSVDVVFTDATLIYIAPDKIEETINEMKRIARIGIVMVEQYHKGEDKSINGCWVRDYGKYFKESKVAKIPPEIWSTGNWGKYGYFIVAKP